MGFFICIGPFAKSSGNKRGTGSDALWPEVSNICHLLWADWEEFTCNKGRRNFEYSLRGLITKY